MLKVDQFTPAHFEINCYIHEPLLRVNTLWFFWISQSLAFDLTFQNLPKKPLGFQLVVALEAFELKQVGSKVPIRRG